MFNDLFDESLFQKKETLSYDDWLKDFSRGLRANPMVEGVKSVLKIVQFVFAREKAFFSMLEEKGVWLSDDTQRLDDKTKEESKNFDKELIKSFVRAASAGNLKIPLAAGGEIVVTPDSAVAALNAFIFDQDEAGTDAAIILVELMGKSEDDLKKMYESYVEQVKIDKLFALGQPVPQILDCSKGHDLKAKPFHG